MPVIESLQEWLKQAGIETTEFLKEPEGKEYAAASFYINDHLIIYRQSKITSLKIGQFVTAWKRNVEGITAPYGVEDNIGFLLIVSTDGLNTGVFIFPKEVLLKQGILSKAGKGGKRGFRVYPPWDIITSKQAIKTKSWQSGHFYNFSEKENLVKKLIKIFAPV